MNEEKNLDQKEVDENFEVAELEDSDLDEASGGAAGNNCNCGCSAD